MDQSHLPSGSIDCLIRARRAAHVYQSEYQRVIVALGPTGLTVARMSILQVLSLRGELGASIADIALDLGVHRTSTAAVVRQLSALGLVATSRDERDARKNTLRITSAGSTLFARACLLLERV